VIVLALPAAYASLVALVWGCLLLATISYVLAGARGAQRLPEVAKHLGVAMLVIVASRIIGEWISRHVQ